MRREVDLNDISDGKRYQSNDMAKIGCNDCKDCKTCCCQNMGHTIILDPYDIYQLTIGLGTSFDELLTGTTPVIELLMADGILLPNIKMQEEGNSCIFLNDDKRCSIHNYRSGFCRMYPLGRIYENGGFSYFNQIHECDYPNKSKVKIKKWLGINNLAEYERFVIKWHDYLEAVREEVSRVSDVSQISRICVNLLTKFYKAPYSKEESFYAQFEQRLELEKS